MEDNNKYNLHLEDNENPILQWAGRRAMVTYASEIYDVLPEVFDEIMNKWGWETVARQLIININYDNEIEYDKDRVEKYLPGIIDGCKLFFSINKFQLCDKVFEELATGDKDENDLRWYGHIGYKELNEALDNYFNY